NADSVVWKFVAPTPPTVCALAGPAGSRTSAANTAISSASRRMVPPRRVGAAILPPVPGNARRGEFGGTIVRVAASNRHETQALGRHRPGTRHGTLPGRVHAGREGPRFPGSR